jgi:hypothetical protein
VSVLRRAYVPVEPDVSGFDEKLREKFQKQDPGGKAGKQLGGQLNRALKRLDLDTVDVRADPRKALAAIDLTEAKLQALSRNASTIEIKVRAEQGLREISRFRKQLGDVGQDAGPEAAAGFFAKFSGRIGPLVASLPIGGPMGIALGGAAVSAAPLIGAAVSGAIIGGVGIGGVVGGLTLAAKDERVVSAAKAIGDRLEGRLNRAAGSFVEPAIKGLDRIEDAVDDFDFGKVFADSAKLVPPLADGVASAITDIGDAVEELVANAQGPVAAIGNGIAAIGDSLGDGLKSLADNGPEASDALRTVFGLISSAITNTLRLVNGMTELYGIVRQFGLDTGFRLALKAMGAELDNVDQAARRGSGGTFGFSQTMIKAKASAEDLKAAQEALKATQDALKVSQDGLNRTIEGFGGKSTTAARTSEALRTAMDNLYGAAIRNTDANEAYQASWDDLSSSVKTNKATLDIHSAAGRANRDVLQGLLGSNNDLYLANLAAGQSVDSARKKHENRTAAIIKEADKLGFNEKKTRDLIKTYGQIPPKKATDLVVEGINQLVIELKRVYLAQRALAEGKTINEVRYAGTAAMRSLHTGGYTGDGGKYEPKGIVHGGEWVINKETTSAVRRQSPGFLEELNATGQLPGYARGGLVAPVETRRTMRFPVDVSDSYVMPKALALSKVIPAFGDWPSSPAAQRGDSGVWRKVLQLIKSGPDQGSFGNAYRPGDPKWHGSGRAVDWMGFNMDALASYLASKRPLELIHRTNRRDYAYTRGVNKGSFNESLMNAHRNHIHIAMDDGGFRMLQPGMNLIPNGTGKQELIGGPAAMASLGGDIHIHIHNSVIASRRQAEDLIVEAYLSAVDNRRLPKVRG